MDTHHAQPAAQKAESQSDWVKTPVANLIRYQPSGTYFARVRIRGKLFRQTLNTNVMSVAKLRLADFMKDKREEMGDGPAVKSGKMTVADAVTLFRQRLDAQQNIKPGAERTERGVPGSMPITEFCDKNRLSAAERLKLFIPVCHAIQSAHEKGIIHRDLKPSSVLVTLNHGEAVPMVIDFGIAEATNQKLPEKTLRGHLSGVSSVAFSADGQRIVTGSYDETAKVWEAANGQELLSLSPPRRARCSRALPHASARLVCLRRCDSTSLR